MHTMPPELLDLFAAARRLGDISPWTLRRHIARGTVTATRLGRRVFLRAEEIERIRAEGLPPLRVTRTPRVVTTATRGRRLTPPRARARKRSR